MVSTALHYLDTELIADRQVVRFSCRICDRCLESGPDGLRLLNRGDPSARHEGGNVMLHADVEQDVPRPPVLH